MAQVIQRQLVNIHLGGKLGALFGEKWTLNVGSPAEALRAININTKGKLLEYLRSNGREKYYRVAIGRKDQQLDASELHNPVGKNDIYIWPTIKGKSGAVKIIIGVVLIVAAIIIAIYDPAMLGPYTQFAELVMVSVGTQLVMGGISQLLAAHKNSQGSLNSNIFQGSIAGGQQGDPVPVVYGRALVAPIPISIWFNNTDWNTTQNAYVGTSELVQLPGGGYEYVSTTPTPSDDSSSDQND